MKYICWASLKVVISLLRSFTASITFLELASKSVQLRKESSPVRARTLSISLPRSYVVTYAIKLLLLLIID